MTHYRSVKNPNRKEGHKHIALKLDCEGDCNCCCIVPEDFLHPGLIFKRVSA